MSAEDISYRTIISPSHGQFKDRGSKFLAFAFPISDAESVKKVIQQLKHDHPSACHVCFAYIIGPTGTEFRANDDGEPNGSAGLPILNQIRSKEITYALVAVVRYFGGTKLGVPGLVNAYKTAAKDALDNAEIVERQPMQQMNLRFPIELIGDIERTVRQTGCMVVSQQFGAECNWTIEFPLAAFTMVESKFRNLLGVDIR